MNLGLRTDVSEPFFIFGVTVCCRFPYEGLLTKSLQQANLQHFMTVTKKKQKTPKNMESSNDILNFTPALSLQGALMISFEPHHKCKAKFEKLDTLFDRTYCCLEEISHHLTEPFMLLLKQNSVTLTKLNVTQSLTECCLCIFWSVCDDISFGHLYMCVYACVCLTVAHLDCRKKVVKMTHMSVCRLGCSKQSRACSQVHRVRYSSFI